MDASVAFVGVPPGFVSSSLGAWYVASIGPFFEERLIVGVSLDEEFLPGSGLRESGDAQEFLR